MIETTYKINGITYEYLYTYYYVTPILQWGQACKFTRIRQDGTMWIGNDEFESQVNYCPMTGKKADVQMFVKKETLHYNDGLIKIQNVYYNEK